jgi:dipeptidyl aminopeptidase/acylaminoacyl peptidase
VDQITKPILLLQGDEDAIVPPPQSDLMYQSLLKRGIPTAYILFKGEQHGFRQAAHIKRAIEAELYFLSKIFGFPLADKIEPVEIKNLK